MLPLGLSLLSLLFGVVSGAQPVEKTIAWYRSQAPFPMPEVTLPSIPRRDFPITGYDAIGDGKTLNTVAFQKAMAAAAAAGRGRVVVPTARGLTGPIE